MILNFLVPSTAHPVGGTMAMFEFANGMARRGHEVHLSHVQFVGPRADSLAEIDWCDLESRLHHHFPEPRPSEAAMCGSDFDALELPDADFVFCFDDRIPTGKGLPLMWVQARGLLGALEEKIFAAPCPKLCISRWLVDVAGEMGVPEPLRVHIPYGLRQDKYRLTAPIDARPRRIAMLHNSHPIKGAALGLDAVAAVLDRLPDADAILFGTTSPARALPDRVTYYDRPDQRFLVERIYNTSSVFVSSSPHEGFGLAAVEAMACGCALVTADNGGSADYAIDGETALVARPNDSDAIATRVHSLLEDGATRIALAQRGGAYARTFDWDRSAELLERFLQKYRSDPLTYFDPR